MEAPQLLASLLKSEEDYQKVLESGLVVSDFGPQEKVVSFMADYLQRFKLFPPLSLLREKFSAQLIDVEADLDFAIKEMQSYVSKRRVESALAEYVSNPEDLTGFINKLQNAEAVKHSESSIRYVDSSIEERYETWKANQIRPNKGSLLLGLRTGLTTLDRTRFGWQRGDLAVIFARPESGKSWLLFNFGVTAWLSGHKVLCVSPEMTTPEVESRVDVLIAGQKGIPVSHRGLRLGGGISDKQFHQLISEMKSRQDFRIHEGFVSVEQIRAMIVKESPKLVLVDSAYMLNETAKDLSERTEKIAKGLKQLAIDHQCIVISVTQAVRDERLISKPPTQTDVAGGDAWFRAADKLISLFNQEKAQTSRFMKIEKDRGGGWAETRGSAIRLHWEVDMGQIYEESH